MSGQGDAGTLLREHASSLLSVATGAVMVRIVLTGDHTTYVRPSTGWLLLIGGVVLVAAGLSGLVSAAGRPAAVGAGHGHDAGYEHGHGHGHDAGQPHDDACEHVHGPPRAALLLLLPLALLVVVAPPSLGAFYAQHSRGSATVEARPADRTALVSTGAPLDLSLGQIERRAATGATLDGVLVHTTGFSAGVEDGRVLLTRFSVRCCAADAIPSQVAVALPPGTEVQEGEWLEVVARWDGPAQGTALLTATSASPVVEPDDPYEL